MRGVARSRCYENRLRRPVSGRDPAEGAPVAAQPESVDAGSKVQLVADLLQNSGHEIDIISQGPVDRRQFRFYPSLEEAEPFNPSIPIHYLSALPVRFLTGLWEGWQIERVIRSRHKTRPYDAMLVYNMKRAQIRCTRYANKQLGIPVILEYEDDSFVDVHGRRAVGPLAAVHDARVREALNTVSAVFAPSPYLLAQCPDGIPKVLVRAVVNHHIVRLRASGLPKRQWVVFSGNAREHARSRADCHRMACHASGRLGTAHREVKGRWSLP